MIGRLYNLRSDEARRRAGEVLERIHLTDAADRQVRTYSGGMRRRLDLAASLVGRPKMLFLDEPTTGVDPRSRHDLWTLIQELVGEGTTVLLTTQYLEEADRLCRRIGVIDHGHLISEGTGDELKSNIGGEYVELHVSDDDAAVSAQVLQSVTGHEPITDHETGAVLVAAPDGILNLMDVVRRLGEAGIHPNDISLRRPTLDEVFLTLTGHAVEAPDLKPSRRRQGARTS
jgi:ABC-2 type transport system ATP-binding protein